MGRIPIQREHPRAPVAQARAGRAADADACEHAARIAEFDGLRGVAAAAIVFFHCGTQRLPGGWAAVDLFFVLSGYLITSIILKYGGAPHFLKTFYIRRALRIWPIYYLTIALVTCTRFFVPQRVCWAGLPYALTYTNLIGLHVFRQIPDFCPYLWHTWSLAVEEQFYVLWPIVILAVGRRRIVPASLLCVAVAAAGRAGGWNWIILGARCDALALGGVLAAILAEGRNARSLRRWLVGVLAVGSIALGTIAATAGLNLPAGPPPWPALTLLAVNAVWFATVGLVVLHAGHPVLRILRAAPLVYVGRISYGLYLYHFVILRVSFEIAWAFGHKPGIPWVKAPAMALSFVVAALSWRFIERPILRWKNRYRYDQPLPASASPSAAVLARPARHAPPTQATRLCESAS